MIVWQQPEGGSEQVPVRHSAQAGIQENQQAGPRLRRGDDVSRVSLKTSLAANYSTPEALRQDAENRTMLLVFSCICI
jgi:hypothetical protein